MRLSVFYIFITRLAMTKNATKNEMGSKSPNIVALVLPLLLILYTLSSQVEVVESTGRKLGKCLYNKFPNLYIQYYKVLKRLTNLKSNISLNQFNVNNMQRFGEILSCGLHTQIHVEVLQHQYLLLPSGRQADHADVVVLQELIFLFLINLHSTLSLSYSVFEF